MKQLLIIITIILISSTFFNAMFVEEKLVPYPEGYRSWTHVRSGMVGTKSANFHLLGGFYHIYANEKAMKGYRTGSFENGSIIVFDRIKMIENENGNIAEGERRLVDVMVKDTNRYDSTGGWGFEEFKGSSLTDRAVRHMAKQSCFNCHNNTKKTDFVFSKYRE